VDKSDLDVVGLGNAIVDVIAEVDEEFLHRYGLRKNSMTLIDRDRADELMEVMPRVIVTSGGSAANTMVGVAGFGGRVGYLGLVADDDLGEVFRKDLLQAGVIFEVPGQQSSLPTARCLIQVTPDAQRTLNTYLGISGHFGIKNVDHDLVTSAAHLYCEGYLWDMEPAKSAIRVAMDLSRGAGRVVSLALSDSFCVERHRDEWRDLLNQRVDVVFGNADELRSLYEVQDLGVAADEVAVDVDVAFVTLGKAGSLVVAGNERIWVEAEEVSRGVVDTTGAGDIYASGALFGLSRDVSLESAARLGSMAAAEVIGHLGARPELDLTVVAGRVLE